MSNESTQPAHKMVSNPTHSDLTDALEELAEDMVNVMSALRSLEAGQAALLDRLDKSERTAAEYVRLTGRQLETIKREVTGDRKWMAHTSALNALAPFADQIDTMRDALDAKENSPLLSQLDAVSAALGIALRGLGFERFKPRAGEGFNAGRMECIGRAAGAPGVVIRTDRSGYQAGEVIVRAAGVVLAEP